MQIVADVVYTTIFSYIALTKNLINLDNFVDYENFADYACFII